MGGEEKYDFQETGYASFGKTDGARGRQSFRCTMTWATILQVHDDVGDNTAGAR